MTLPPPMQTITLMYDPKVLTMKIFNPSLENLFQWPTVLLVEHFLPFVFCTWCLNLKKSGEEYLQQQQQQKEYKRTILLIPPCLVKMKANNLGRMKSQKISTSSQLDLCLFFLVLPQCSFSNNGAPKIN